MRHTIRILLVVLVGWLAPSAFADRLVSQEPKIVHRRVITEREYLPHYYKDDGVTYRSTVRYRDLDDDDDDDDDDYEVDDDDDDDDDRRVIIRRPARVERRVIIRD